MHCRIKSGNDELPSSCPASCRASTSFGSPKQDVDGRDKPGHDRPDVFPGRSAARSGALQTRDRRKRGVCNDPGSAVHRFALHRIRETLLVTAGSSPAVTYNRPQVSAV